MSKAKYYYDQTSASYKAVVKSKLQKIKSTLAFLFVSILFGVIISVFAFKYIKSSKENTIGGDLEEMKLQYELLKKKMDVSQNVLKEIETRDSTIYHKFFGIKQTPFALKYEGDYSNFKNLEHADLVIETTKKLDDLNQQLVAQSKSLDLTIDLAKKKNDIFIHLPAIQPIANKDLKRLASGFGMRLHPVLNVQKMHWGLDFSADPGTPIYATGDATVAKAEPLGGLGNCVILDHQYGYETLYAHMSSFKVSVGEIVKRGDIIGFVGTTGLSSGPHLHYEIHKNGQKIDPIYFFYQDVSPDQFKNLYDQSQKMSISLD